MRTFYFFCFLLFQENKTDNKTGNKTKNRKKRSHLGSQKKNATLIIHQICKTIKEHFPKPFDRIAQQVKDPRKRKEYNLAEILMAAVIMFLFKEGSRNAFNNERRQERFFKNYERLFGYVCPTCPPDRTGRDTVEALRLLQPGNHQADSLPNQ